MLRTAIVKTDHRAESVAPYLPGNYGAAEYAFGGKITVIITGEDNAGWTLDGYVIPRLGSGLIVAEEIVRPDPLRDGVLEALLEADEQYAGEVLPDWADVLRSAICEADGVKHAVAQHHHLERLLLDFAKECDARIKEIRAAHSSKENRS